MKNWSNKIHKYLSLVAIISVFVPIYSCRDAEELPPGNQFGKSYESVTIQFSKSFENVAEGEEVILQLTVDRAATKNMKFSIAVETNGIFNQHFITDHIIENDRMVVYVLPGQSTVSIKFKALDNITFDQGKYIAFTLSNADEDINFGRTTKLTLIIEDDEAPSIANFAVNTGSINEKDSDGIMVEVLLSAPATDSGKIFVSSPQNLIDFITDKPVSGNLIELEVNKGDTRAGFKVLPIYNSDCSNKSVLFTMTGFFGVVRSGDNLAYGLTITNSDISTISIDGTTGSVNESNSSGILLHIDITPMAREDIHLYLIVSDNENIDRYSTIPPVEGDSFDGYYIRMFVPKNSTGVDLKIIPVNDTYKNNNHVVDFSLFNSNFGSCYRINAATTYKLTIVDDE